MKKRLLLSILLLLGVPMVLMGACERKIPAPSRKKVATSQPAKKKKKKRRMRADDLHTAGARLVGNDDPKTLRVGDDLKLLSSGGGPAPVEASAVYAARITVLRGETTDPDAVCCGSGSSNWVSSLLYTGARRALPEATLLHNVGQDQMGLPVRGGDYLRITLVGDKRDYQAHIKVHKRKGSEAPHVYASADRGRPINSFLLGCGKAPCRYGDARKGPVYVSGSHLPPATKVHIYVLRGSDSPRGLVLRPRHQRVVAGPVTAITSARGRLKGISTKFVPTAPGAFTIVVDVDRDGKVDPKPADGVDGVGRAGFAAQYGPQWLEQNRVRHLLASLSHDGRGSFADDFMPGKMAFARAAPLVHVERPWPVIVRPQQLTTGTFVVIPHQSWDGFWNATDPRLDAGCKGCRDLRTLAVRSGKNKVPAIYTVAPQRGSLFTKPIPVLDPRLAVVNAQGKPVRCFDLVFIPHENERKRLIYRPGRAFIDTGRARDRKTPEKTTQKVQCGFRITKLAAAPSSP